MRQYFFAIVLLLMGSSGFAQGVLVDSASDSQLPRPLPTGRVPRPVPQPNVPESTQYEIDSLKVDGKIQDQIAQIQVTQVFKNSGSRTIESQFVFPLPYDAAIDSLTLLVDGKELVGQLLTAEEAKQKYQDIVRKKQDPAWLQWIGTGLYQTSVFPIPAGASRTVTITYSQLLKKTDSLSDFLFPLAAARYSATPVKVLSLNLHLTNQFELKSIYSPTHDVKIERDGTKTAKVSFSKENVIPNEDFRLYFDNQHGEVGASLLSTRNSADEAGYFMLLASPGAESNKSEPIPKTVVFLMDISGSMSGEKMKQAQSAARQLVGQLNDNDLLSLVVFNSQVSSFRPELEIVNDENRAAAIQFIEGQFAGGATNINQAMLTGLKQAQGTGRPSYVLLMTDGQPTADEVNEMKIAANVMAANSEKAHVIVFGVGYDVNSRLLDRLARDGRGQAEYVRENENIELAVSRVINRINRPVLTGNTLVWKKESGEDIRINRVYPHGEFDLFAGEQLVIVGRYQDSGPATIKWTGRTQNETHEATFKATFAEASSDHQLAFIPRLWAMRRIGELIDELDLKGKNDELVKELVQLSTEYGILTPYTSYLADENVRPDLASSSNLSLTDDRLSLLSESSGAGGFEQRGLKQQFRNAQSLSASELDVFSADAPAIASSLRAGERFLPNPRGGSGLGADLNQLNTGVVPVEATSKRQILVRHGQTFYQQGKVLLTPETADIDLEKNRDKYQIVKRNSDEYFELIAQNSVLENSIFSEQPVDLALLIKLRGQVYLIQ